MKIEMGKYYNNDMVFILMCSQAQNQTMCSGLLGLWDSIGYTNMLSLYIISFQSWNILMHKSDKFELIFTEILVKEKYLTHDSTRDALHYISYNMSTRTQDNGKIYCTYHKNMDTQHHIHTYESSDYSDW
jgi:hypothetical protein